MARAKWSRSVSFCVLVIVTCMLLGCDTGSEIMIENHSDECITVRFFFSSREVGPCSAYYEGFVVIPGTDLGWIPYAVTDADGNLLAEGDIPILRGKKRGGHTWNIIRYPARGPGDCAKSTNNLYRVRIINDTSEVIPVFFDDIDLGDLQIGEEFVVGPLPGRLWQVPEIRVPDADGDNRVTNYYVGLKVRKSIPPYPLGDIPVIYLAIRDRF